MRNNQPVTQVEQQLKDHEYIVSKTDLKGRITYVNRPFLEISGFTEDELLGSPHNIVRHPDMPPEAFQDLWSHLRAGRSWQGMVKNRCKNGDYYWVQANANPIWENGEVTGFMSLRSRPTLEQVREAEAFYALLRAQPSRKWTVRHGRPARTGFRGVVAEALHQLRERRSELLAGLLPVVSLALCALEVAARRGTSVLQAADAGELRLALAAMLVCLGILVVRHVRSSLLRPLRLLERDLQTISAGILATDASRMAKTSSSHLLQAIDTMRGNLSSIVQDIRAAARQIGNASHEVASASESLSQATAQQAASVEETSTALEQAGTSVQQNADNARQTDGIATEAAQQARKSGSAVEQTVDAMQGIAERISVIDDIAYQTNMLALNAAIEAARAGEHGLGFAVVAAEVRKLAEKSQAAAKEIGELAGTTVRQAEQAGCLLHSMVPSIAKTSDLVREISAASDEQSTSIQRISEAVAMLSQTTQGNASASEELASTSEQMSEQARVLDKAMAQFRLSGESAMVFVSRAERKRLQQQAGFA